MLSGFLFGDLERVLSIRRHECREEAVQLSHGSLPPAQLPIPLSLSDSL